MKTKSNCRVLMLSSVVCLLPLILSVMVYNDLPEQIAVHWNTSGNPDTTLPKVVAAFGLPLLILALNLLSKAKLYTDPARDDVSGAMRVIAEWLPPVVSLVAVPITLFVAMGINIPITVVIPALMGVIFMIVGNYLPKSRRNYTVGIKLPWTLHNDDNWNKTHRLAGYLWMLGGILLIIGTFVANNQIFITVLTVIIAILLIGIPVLYSCLQYRKNGKE